MPSASALLSSQYVSHRRMSSHYYIPDMWLLRPTLGLSFKPRDSRLDLVVVCLNEVRVIFVIARRMSMVRSPYYPYQGTPKWP